MKVKSQHVPLGLTSCLREKVNQRVLRKADRWLSEAHEQSTVAPGQRSLIGRGRDKHHFP